MNTPCGSFQATDSRANIFQHRFSPSFQQPRTSRAVKGQPSGSPAPPGVRLAPPPHFSRGPGSSSDITNMVDSSMDIQNTSNGGASPGERAAQVQAAAEEFPQQAPSSPPTSTLDSVPVFVMLPLDTINADGVFKYATSRWFLAGLQQLKESGIHGVAVDVWVSAGKAIVARCRRDVV